MNVCADETDCVWRRTVPEWRTREGRTKRVARDAQLCVCVFGRRRGVKGSAMRVHSKVSFIPEGAGARGGGGGRMPVWTP